MSLLALTGLDRSTSTAIGRYQTAGSGLRIQIVVVALAIPAIYLYLRGTNPGSFTVMDEPLGQYVLLPGAILLEVLGLLLWRRFTRARP